MKFDILEIQKIVEEKRLFYGEKIEKFALSFLKKISNFSQDKLLDFFSNKKSILISCTFIIITSFFIRADRDFGVKSAYLLDQIRFFGSFISFPLNHFFASLIILLSNKFNLDLRFTSEIITNTLGIFSLLICYKILFFKKDEFITKNILYLRHFLMFAVCFAFFYRIYLIQFNEYLTFSGIFIALISPIICFYFKKDRFSYIALSLSFIALSAFLYPKFLLDFGFYNKNYLHIFYSDFLLSFLFFAFTFSYVKQNNILKNFLLLGVLSSLFSIFDENYEFRSLFFAFILPAVFYTVFLIIKDNKFDLKKNWLWISAVIICAQFDGKVFTALTHNLTVVWAFILLKETYFDKKNNQFSLAKIFTLTILISYFISLILAMILNQKDFYASSLKSPNYVSDQQNSLIKKYASKNSDEILIISDEMSDSYPLLLNLHSETLNATDVLPAKAGIQFLYTKFLYDNISNDKENSWQLTLLKEKINDKNNRLIFVRIKNFSDKLCKIGFLENYFFDQTFKKSFLKNYKFLTTIEEIENRKIMRKLTNQESESYEGSEEYFIIKNKIEVYIRKDAK